MKSYKILNLLFAMIVWLPVLAQTNSRLGNENYMYNVFFEDFLGNQLISDNWQVVDQSMSGIGILANDPRTLRVLDSNLELSMIYSPNYTSGNFTGDYVGAEIISKKPYSYGIFECYARFAHQNGSWPAFWLFNGDGLPCPPGGYGNEIDIAELKCEDSSLSIDHVIHRYYPNADCSGQYHLEKDYHEYYGMSFDNNFHLFKCIWTPDKITYYVDNIQTHQVINSGQEWFPKFH